MHETQPTMQSLSDAVDPARAQAMFAALGMDRGVPAVGDALPPFFHQLYFWDARPPTALGRDGHPRVGTGGIIPDMGLPRRMWAGGRLEFHAPFRAGIQAVRTTTVENTVRKQGKSGPLAFVTLRHDICQGTTPVVSEYQDLVYREDPDSAAPPPATRPAPEGEETCDLRGFDATLLFRYSALTFNGHRIHYDLDYCRNVEGYSGLVVHGPLLAQLLMLKGEAEIGALASFSFKATAPLVHSERAAFCRKGHSLWVRGPDGRLCMEAQATPA